MPVIGNLLGNYIELNDNAWKMVDLFTLSFTVQAVYQILTNSKTDIKWGAACLCAVVTYNILFYKFFQ